MSTLVVHASKYGSTERYARWIGEALEAPVVGSHAITPSGLAEHDVVVFCSAIYGPSLRDCVELRRAMELGSDTRWVLVTVGLSDPEVSTRRDDLVAAKFTEDQLARLTVFHLRGAMNRDRLTFVDRSMMATIRAALAAKSEPSAEDLSMLQVLEPERVDLTSRSGVEDIVASVQVPEQS